MKIRKLITLACVFTSASLVFCGDFNDYENQIIQDVLNFRFSTRQYATSDEAIEATKLFHESLLVDEVQNNLGEEAKLTVDNFLVLQQYDYIYERNAKDPELGPFITAQYEKIAAWNETHTAEESNPYYILSSGDLINSTMQFLQQGQAIKLGLKEKKDYDMVIEKYPELSLGLINTGLWYYFAPAIGGGSNAKAREYFTRAVACAKNKYEEFYSNIYYSQFLYEKNEKDQVEKYLSAADSLMPGNRYIKLIREMNAIGYSVLYYSNNRDKVDAKLEKKKNK